MNQTKTRKSNKGNRKTTQGKVEKALYDLALNNPDAISEWELMVKYNAEYNQLKAFLHSHGYENIEIINICNWWNRNRPKGKEAIAINSLAEIYKGVEESDLNEMAIGLTAKISTMLFSAISEEDIQKSSTSTKISNLIEALKELRINSSESNSRKNKIYAKELKLEGALILGDKLKSLFLHTQFYPALEKAIDESLQNISQL